VDLVIYFCKQEALLSHYTAFQKITILFSIFFIHNAQQINQFDWGNVDSALPSGR